MPQSPAAGCPIRISADLGIFAPPRGFSQLVTSFFASGSQGILHVPFSPFLGSFLFENYFVVELSFLSSMPKLVFANSFDLIFSFQYVNALLAWSCDLCGE